MIYDLTNPSDRSEVEIAWLGRLGTLPVIQSSNLPRSPLHSLLFRCSWVIITLSLHQRLLFLCFLSGLRLRHLRRLQASCLGFASINRQVLLISGPVAVARIVKDRQLRRRRTTLIFGVVYVINLVQECFLARRMPSRVSIGEQILPCSNASSDNKPIEDEEHPIR